MTDNLVAKSSILTTEYGVMKEFLSQLPIKQLNKAAVVCKAWHETAKIIKKSRCQIYTYANKESHEDYVGIEQLFKSIRSQPCLCIAFLTNYGQCEQPTSSEESSSFGRYSEYKILKYLRTQLPTLCPIIGGITPGVVASKICLETIEIEDGEAFGMFLIPELHNVAIRHFYLDRKSMRRVGAAIVSKSSDVGQMLNLQDKDDVQCLVLIGTDPHKESKCLEAICGFACEKNPQVAIGGGFLEAIIHPKIPDHDQSCGIMGLAFCGPQIRADSIVIPHHTITVTEVEKMILQLKRGHDLGKRSVGFMFACVARGIHLFGQSGVESSLFRKHFPDTPLLGFFGNGEIGISSVNVQSTNSIPSAPKKSRSTYLYSYATIFVLLSFPE